MNKSGGISFMGALLLLLVGLKLTHNIDWNWYFVLSPLTWPITLGVAIFVAVIVLWAVASFAELIYIGYKRARRKLKKKAF